ncbi:MAG: universal stress protein [Acidimicrobiia bacterium]|nr:universal stress protein [Acidimicrobiia bacterium]MBT8191942.1 universal stress protein [Acidimicrobiia bacterium]MBT8248339.1 universal stress protein [Acidimicrobiia bacterium]NNF87565.1 universal stress protein [Acidimicrobiia bacterium]NNL13946.1 universal stress protein [Acidimicrobiia bacterium]
MDPWSPNVIVAATDGSEQSLRAANAAAALARTNDAHLFIVTVVRPPEGWWGIVGAPPPAESLGNALADAQRVVLEKTVEAVDLSGVRFDTVEEVGDPANQLAAFSEEKEADLMVIGQRGAGLVERIMVGSVADRLVHIATVPVLVVP